MQRTINGSTVNIVSKFKCNSFLNQSASMKALSNLKNHSAGKQNTLKPADLNGNNKESKK